MSDSSSGTGKLKIAAAAAALSPLLLLVGLATVVAGTSGPDLAGVSCTVGTGAAEKLDLSGEQLDNAASIHAVAAERDLPIRASVIGIATAMQESTLTNLGHLGDLNDHDSQGLFQQRPSQGWGTVEQIRDPEYASGKFFDKLVTVEGWETLPLTVAAQAVQRSAYPDAYAKWEPMATDIVTALTGQTTCTATASGWVAPVAEGIVSGYRTAERPDHNGVDFGSPRGTPILAVAAGEIVTLACNASTANGAAYSCDIDGSPAILGCGWYIEIQHTDNTLTRYCHMSQKPSVQIGQTVQAGQTIGLVGSSGNSSGPHLHFETHSGYPASGATALPPLEFMSERGVQIE